MSLSWIQRSFLAAGGLLLLYQYWSTAGLSERVVRDVLVFIIGPLMLGLSHGRRIGWRVDGTAIRNTFLLAAFVLPFYVVGSTLPSIRSFYPMWHTTLALGEFVPHAVQLFLLALATETYFRGLLCVGVREIGFKAVFISPVVYALLHAGKPPVEFLLSGPTDVLFGSVDYYSESILPSVVAHGAGLVLLDWLVLREPLLPPELILRTLRWLPVPL
jgi:hypothetical protein